MKRIKHYLKRLKNLNFDNMKRVADKIAKETGKKKFLVLFDMVISSVLYSVGYSEYYEYEFYLLNHKERKTFMTAASSNQIIMKYNQKEYRDHFYNKTKFNETFKDLIGRDWLDIRSASDEEVEQFIEKHETLMIKQTENLMGIGIEKIETASIKDPLAFKAQCMETGQYLWEEFFIQHKDLSTLYPGSVNTIRIISFFDGKDTHILEGVLKMGNGGNLDNFGAGGMYTILDEQGVALYPAFDGEGDTYATHPMTKTEIVGFQVPHYDKIIEMVNKASQRVPQVQYVGWDVAVGPEKPILIEGNYNTGVFQMKPSLSGSKIGLKPHFRKYIDI